MTNVFRDSILQTKTERYLSLLLLLAPLLNFLSGISFDLHAPSLPAIATYFHASTSAVKNTITITLLGFSLGCIIFGALLDKFGRRPMILLGLFVYTIVSFLALICHSIDQLLLVRFFQGFSVAGVSIGCRTIIIDKFTGHQFKVAMLYSSLAFGIGPIIAPFIGGFLQYHFGWQACFIAYGLVSSILMLVFLFYIAESKVNDEPFLFKHIYLKYLETIKQNHFWPGIIISGLSQIQLLVYTTTGAFIIENILHRSAITYGNTALIISCGYLFGTLANRVLINYFRVDSLINFGFVLLFLSVLSQVLFSLFGHFDLLSIILPITLIGFSNGFIFLNVFTCCLSLSTNAGGIATSLYTSALMIIGSIGTYIISHLHVNSLTTFAIIFGLSGILQLLIYLLFFRNVAKQA